MSSENTFDRWQWDGKRARAAGKDTSLSFDDIQRMSTFQHKPSGERRLPTPKWSLNDLLLRELLVVFLEERCAIRNPEGTLIERRNRAAAAVIAQREAHTRNLLNHCERYRKLKEFGLCPELTDVEVNELLPQPYMPGFEGQARIDMAAKNLRALAIEIEGLDTLLRYTENGGIDTIASVVYLYFRCKLDSPTVAELLGLKAPHIRQIIYRLAQTWKNKFRKNHEPEPQDVPSEPLFSFLSAE